MGVDVRGIAADSPESDALVQGMDAPIERT